MTLIRLLPLLLGLAAASPFAAEEPLEPEQAYQFSARAIDAKTVEARWQIADWLLHVPREDPLRHRRGDGEARRTEVPRRQGEGRRVLRQGRNLSPGSEDPDSRRSRGRPDPDPQGDLAGLLGSGHLLPADTADRDDQAHRGIVCRLAHHSRAQRRAGVPDRTVTAGLDPSHGIATGAASHRRRRRRWRHRRLVQNRQAAAPWRFLADHRQLLRLRPAAVASRPASSR